MPGARRVKKGITAQKGADPQINKGPGDFGGGPQANDGSENKGNTPYEWPKPIDTASRVIKTS